MWAPSRLAIERIARRRSLFFCRVDPSAFAAIMMAFIFLFIAKQLAPHHSSHADLVSVQHSKLMPGAMREDLLLLTISRDGHYFFGPSEIRLNDLVSLLQAGLRNGAERKVYLRVDARARYSDVTPALDQINRTGLQQICFLTW